MLIKLKIKENYPILIITVVYWLVSIWLYQKFGVKYVADSPRYMEYATNLNNGFYFDPHNFWYIGYVLFIKSIQIISTDLIWLVGAQYVLTYLSVIVIYKLSLELFANRTGALFSSLVYILFIDSIYWSSYILAESFYVSLLCISFYLLMRWYKEPGNKILIIVAIPTLLLTMLAKPTGIALAVAIFIFIVYRLIKRVKSLVIKILTIGALSIVLMLLVNRMLTTFAVIDNEYIRGDIIYGISSLLGHPDATSLIVEPPVDMQLPAVDHPKIVRIVLFIVQNFHYWAEISTKKVFYFLAHVRPYWSWQHNLYVLFFLVPAYLSLIVVFFRKILSNEIVLFIMAYLCVHISIIAITTVDWDGRFILPILPIVFVFLGHMLGSGIDSVKQRYVK